MYNTWSNLLWRSMVDETIKLLCIMCFWVHSVVPWWSPGLKCTCFHHVDPGVLQFNIIAEEWSLVYHSNVCIFPFVPIPFISGLYAGKRRAVLLKQVLVTRSLWSHGSNWEWVSRSAVLWNKFLLDCSDADESLNTCKLTSATSCVTQAAWEIC